jgi:glycosyltransferase involved in cell wall biosynthesis
MKDKPLVSIALCTYNGENFIEKQLLSIKNQTYQNLEIIIFDDLSSDETINILNQHALQDTRIKVFQNQNNIGYIKNFENAIKKSSGDYIFLCDQDDVWDIKKIEIMLNYFDDKTLLAFHDSKFIDSNEAPLGKNLSDRFTLEQRLRPISFLLFNGIPGHTLGFRKELIEKILPLPTIVHHDCWIAFIASCLSNIAYVPQLLVEYRQHQSSETDLLKIKKPSTINNLKSIQNKQLIERTKIFEDVVYNTDRDLFKKFKNYLIQREFDLLSLKLFLFMFVYHDSIFNFKKNKGLLRLVYTFQYFFGLKFRK